MFMSHLVKKQFTILKSMLNVHSIPINCHQNFNLVILLVFYILFSSTVTKISISDTFGLLYSYYIYYFIYKYPVKHDRIILLHVYQKLNIVIPWAYSVNTAWIAIYTPWKPYFSNITCQKISNNINMRLPGHVILKIQFSTFMQWKQAFSLFPFVKPQCKQI